ncbi:MAG TPA: helix-turn-helix domain-containing protein [Terriglobia bacterium]|nr:helix-turn-helix domain-containing protein [Terriglobia bacterium]
MSGHRLPQSDNDHSRLVFQGATLKSLRQHRRLTLRALAQRLGVTYQAVHNWEKGINDPSADLLAMIAHELQCEIGDLYLKTVPPPSSETEIPVGDQNFLQELFAALLLEGVPRQSAQEARDLAARLVTEARTPPGRATGVTAAAEALIRVQTLLRQRKR